MAAPERTYWDAETYERMDTPMRRWAQALIADLDLKGDETVLDAGCGSGSVTFDLLDRLPQGKVYAVDSSPQMIKQLGSGLRQRGITNVSPLLASLTDFSVPEPVDVVFSNAVFHWIKDDDALFGCLVRNTKPGGKLRAQCGGSGNIARLTESAHAVEAREPYSEHIREPTEPRKYRTPDQLIEAMSRNGWADVRASLFESPVAFPDEDEAVVYLRTVILQQQDSLLPDALRERFLRDVIAEVQRRHGSPFVADYVRLDIWATRA